MKYFEGLKSQEGMPMMLKALTIDEPRSKIYYSVDLYEYETNGWPAEAFEGLELVFESVSSWVRCGSAIFIFTFLLQCFI